MTDPENKLLDHPIMQAIALVVIAALVWVIAGAIMAEMFG